MENKEEIKIEEKEIETTQGNYVVAQDDYVVPKWWLDGPGRRNASWWD